MRSVDRAVELPVGAALYYEMWSIGKSFCRADDGLYVGAMALPRTVVFVIVTDAKCGGGISSRTMCDGEEFLLHLPCLLQASCGTQARTNEEVATDWGRRCQ